MTMLIDLEQVKRKLKYGGVREYRYTTEDNCGTFHVFQAVPEDESLPAVEVVFDEGVEFLQHVGFSHWHAHYDSWADERRNVVRALRAAREIIEGAVVLCEEYDSDGKCLGETFVRDGETPRRFIKKSAVLKVIKFNRPIEVVNFRR